MKSSWIGLIACCFVIYFGVVHSLENPFILLNPHAIILVIGGTIAISFLTYPFERLSGVVDFLLFGFLFRLKKTEATVARDLIAHIDHYYQQPVTFTVRGKPHPFLVEAFYLLNRSDLTVEQLHDTLLDRRNALKRRYIEDAKILNNIAKYPPHLGLLGAASGMIEMMSQLGKAGADTIGASMAVALSATLWGVGLNNFVFLPLSDNSMKVSEDEIYLRDIIIESCLLMKKREPHEVVIRACINKLSLIDRNQIKTEYSKNRRDETRHAG